jgi:hypothetical protein
MLSEIIRNRPINKHNNCTLPDGSEVKVIEYKHSCRDYKEYRYAPSFILYQKRTNNLRFDIYFTY